MRKKIKFRAIYEGKEYQIHSFQLKDERLPFNIWSGFDDKGQYKMFGENEITVLKQYVGIKDGKEIYKIV